MAAPKLAILATSSLRAFTEFIPHVYGHQLSQRYMSPACKPQYKRNEIPNIYHHSLQNLELTYLHIKPHFTRYGKKSSRYLFYYHDSRTNVLDSNYFLYLLHSELERHLSQYEWHVISTEYPGYCPDTYGVKVNESDVQKHALFSLKFLMAGFAIESYRQVYIMGQSIGTGIATYIASQTPSVAGVMLISAFTSIKDISADSIGRYFGLLLAERINNQKQLSAYPGPVLLIHGKLDTVILPKHASQLMQHIGCHGLASSISLKWLQTSGHDDMDRQEMFQYIVDFVATP
jgi:esterase/lipase